MTPSEKITSEICKKSFLSFWSYPNPVRKDNHKELTDILIFNYPVVIIISVKEINIKESGDLETDRKRWYKRGIEKSYKQIYGAERIIRDDVSKILTCDSKQEIDFIELDKLKIYRIGVSIGRKEAYSLPFGYFESGFVHFFDQESFPIILNELDTISDFIDYIESKEESYTNGQEIVFKDEKDLLAFYLANGRHLPENYNKIQLDSSYWEDFISSNDYRRRKIQERKSYLWDSIIEEFFDCYDKEILLFSNELHEVEESLRAMSKENRFARYILSEALAEVVIGTAKTDIRARMCHSPSGIAYVFLIEPHDEENREERIKRLRLRCLAARNISDSSTVVGIATNHYEEKSGHSYDLCYVYIEELSDIERKKISTMQKELGYFIKSRQIEKSYDEYPQ